METTQTPPPNPDTASPAAAATSVQPEPAPAPLPDTAPSSPPPTRRHYTLWELVRHEDHDRPAPQSDPTDSVLASMRPSAWLD